MSTAIILKEWFGVKPAAGRVAAALYEAKGAARTKAQLMEASSQTRTGVDYSLKCLRLQMDPGAIDFSRSEGYRLTAVGMRDCAKALADAAKRAKAEKVIGR